MTEILRMIYMTALALLLIRTVVISKAFGKTIACMAKVNTHGQLNNITMANGTTVYSMGLAI